MDLVKECRRRQVKLLKLIKALEENVLLSELDDDTIERLKRSIGKSVGLYEKAIHVLNREQVGHA